MTRTEVAVGTIVAVLAAPVAAQADRVPPAEIIDRITAGNAEDTSGVADNPDTTDPADAPDPWERPDPPADDPPPTTAADVEATPTPTIAATPTPTGTPVSVPVTVVPTTTAGTDPVETPVVAAPVQQAAPVTPVAEPSGRLAAESRRALADRARWRAKAQRAVAAERRKADEPESVARQSNLELRRPSAPQQVTPPGRVTVVQATVGQRRLGTRKHVVQAGECLSIIAARYGLSWPLLAARNAVSGPDYVIHPGQVLALDKGV